MKLKNFHVKIFSWGTQENLLTQTHLTHEYFHTQKFPDLQYVANCYLLWVQYKCTMFISTLTGKLKVNIRKAKAGINLVDFTSIFIIPSFV